jgi:hypothetical protein
MNVSTMTLDDRIGLIKGWLIGSGIQSAQGGFYAWRDMEDDSHSYLYSEITGYAITALCFLYAVTKEKVFVNNAGRAAQWIMQDALDGSGGVLTRKYAKDAVEHYSFERGNIYSFDCGMVAFGMLKLYKATSDPAYLDCAEKIIKFLNGRMLRPDGLYYPVFDTKKGLPVENTVKWSTQSGSFHSKLALCLCELAGIKKDSSYNAAAKRLIEASVKTFDKAGRFVTNTADDTSHLHPYCYTLEGMLYYSYRTGDTGYADTVEDAFKWIAGLQADNGALPTQVSGAGKSGIVYQRADIQAQVLRLSYFIGSGLYRERLIERLLELQNVSEGLKGAFLFGTDKDGSFKKHGNAWCSMFALQALYLASGRVKNETVLEYLV